VHEVTYVYIKKGKSHQDVWNKKGIKHI